MSSREPQKVPVSLSRNESVRVKVQLSAAAFQSIFSYTLASAPSLLPSVFSFVWSSGTESESSLQAAIRVAANMK